MQKMDEQIHFASISDACRITGLSQHFLREGCKNGKIPYVLSGKKYMVNVAKLLEQLDAAS